MITGMIIQNAEISEVELAYNEQKGVFVRLTIIGEDFSYFRDFFMKNEYDGWVIEQLFCYTDSETEKELKGKCIRVVCDGVVLYGFGHLMKDEFVPFIRLTSDREILCVIDMSESILENR